MDFCPYLNERDACGVGFVANIEGQRSFKILQESNHILTRMYHRGGCQCSSDDEIPTGDGAGVMTGLPHELYSKIYEEISNGEKLQPGKYATGIMFMEEDKEKAQEIMAVFEKYAEKCSCKVLGWRKVPSKRNNIGPLALKTEPTIMQVFVSSDLSEQQFHKKIYLLRKSATHGIPKLGYRFYICSLSTQTIVYKGCFASDQLFDYYLDLQNPEFKTHVAVVHSRYSTNTSPTWERAHPQRMIAHNGEINTIQGNVKNTIAREGNMTSKYYENMEDSIFPVIEKELTDSGCLDNILEFLVTAGDKSLPEAVMCLVPEAWQNDKLMEEYKRDYYKWVSCSMEPWDGPALITFCDGQYVGATLDRNGLRPARYYVTSDNIMVMASEVGVSSIPPQDILHKGRLMPGKMLLVDTKLGAVVKDEELKLNVARKFPIAKWLKENSKTLTDFYDQYLIENHQLPNVISQQALVKNGVNGKPVETDKRLPLFGYSIEDINMLLLPMVRDGKEAYGSMGNDAPLACMSKKPQLVFDYFKQLFAQVTNPPIDPFREQMVMSIVILKYKNQNFPGGSQREACPIGPESNLLCSDESTCKRVHLESPVLSTSDLEVLTSATAEGWKTLRINITYSVGDGLSGLVPALDSFCTQAEEGIKSGYSFILLTDRAAGPSLTPVSTLLAVGAVHQYLTQKKLRKKVGIIVEGGEVREIHHLCTLLGFGADAICPYMVFETFSQLSKSGLLNLSDENIVSNYKKAAGIGMRKVFAKMGISTLHSYKGSQIFEAVGLGKEVMNKCFTGTVSRLSGVTFEILSREALERHQLAFSERECDSVLISSKGAYHWREGGEKHINEPKSIAHLQNAAQNNNTKAYKQYIESSMETIRNCTLRGQLEFTSKAEPIPLSEVEDAAEIVKRFCTGAMSFGSISEETHKTLAIAMNRMGGRSNSGEGGEDPERFIIQDLNFNSRSSIKQVASARFGVTHAYLVNANELQIKMAQGAKPGEGGELPGFKVSEDIAKTRHSTPGVTLTSPPPHHDIYSIEDLAQLIYDLKCSNPNARISVKLVSEVGVGIIACGVAKGLAEHIVISGHDGGTGASSWTGIKHAGLPWELGITETHQALVNTDLRKRVILQTDGQIKTGHDVLVAALMGSDEYAFSTAPLITLGCTMMRKCHLNTCPVGIATQDPVLREKFTGKPEHVINFFFMVAEEVRLLLAELGFRSLQEVIGRTDLLRHLKETTNDKTQLLDFSAILNPSAGIQPVPATKMKQDFKLEIRKENELLSQITNVLNGIEKSVVVEANVENIDRTFGTTISHQVITRYQDGLPDDSIHIRVNGAGGQSFGAFVCAGITIELEGDANDYVGKGLSGGIIIIYPNKCHDISFKPDENIIVGNVCLYGATSGKAFFSGIAAERFCVRNSGATAVAEGCGDHGCEYMTGGRAVILGKTGRNFAAGMSGGIAYIYDVDGTFPQKCNLQCDNLEQPTAGDFEWLESIIREHRAYTNSPIARNILETWSQSHRHFVKVYPEEYKRAIEKNKVKESTVRSVSNKDPSASPPEKRMVVDIEDTIRDQEKDKINIDKILDKKRGFVLYKRNHQKYRKPKDRMKDWNEVYAPLSKHELKVQTARCMDCGVPFCQSNTGCPLGNVIPQWNDLVFKGEWKQALHRLLQTNNFPEFTGRVCPAPCESACVLGINAEPVTIKSIECKIIDHAFEQGWMKPQIPSRRTGKRIGIIGSGAAGLAAASQLNKAGHSVTVFERNDRCGGLLVYGIPTMKLSKDVVQRRIDLMAAEGIEFRTNTNIGGDENSDFLLKDFNSILLAIGSTWPRDLPIPGRQLSGIHFAMEFLETSQKHNLGKYNLPKLDAKGKSVLIIGGGDTGTDCMATSLRMEAKSVTTFELLSEPPKKRPGSTPWPQWPRIFRVEYGIEEVAVKYGKDPRIFSILCKEFVGNSEGHVTAALTVDIEWEMDKSGRHMMKEIPGSERRFEADIVLLALGFLGPEKSLTKLLGVSHNMRSNIETEQGSFQTSVPRVYAAGDCHYGQSLIVRAIAEGRQAARQIDLDLMGCTSLAGPGGEVVTSTLEVCR